MLGPIAYLDPGTGSLFLQILLGGVAGLAVFIKLFWRRILSILGIGSGNQPAEASVDDPPADPEG
jgi:hypothetical protein